MLRLVVGLVAVASVAVAQPRLPIDAISLGSHCYDHDGGGHSTIPVTFGFEDSGPNTHCTVTDDVQPDEPLAALNGAGSTFFIGVEDQWGADSGRIESVCIAPDSTNAATEECFNNLNIVIPDRRFRSVNVTLTGGNPINNPRVRITLGPLTPPDFYPGDYHFWIAALTPPTPPAPASLVTGFGLIVYGDANIASGNVGGRAAIGGNLVAGTASIGTDICSENLDIASMGPGTQQMLPCAGPRPWSLLVNGDATWPSGGLFPRAATPCGSNTGVAEECAFVNGAVLGSPTAASPLNTQLCNNTLVPPCTGASCLTTAFTGSKAALDASLAGSNTFGSSSVTYENKWSGIILNCSGPASAFTGVYNVRIDRADWNAATWFATTASCDSFAGWVVALVNAAGSDLGENVTFSGGSFPSTAANSWFLVEGSASVAVAGMSVTGSLIAPSAAVSQSGGNVNGYLIANTYDASAASINTPCATLAQSISTDEILVRMGAAVRPSAPDARRQTTQNPNCVPDDVIIVPAHGPIRANDTVTVGSETAIVAELLTVGSTMEPAFRFTAPLTGTYPTRTATVTGVIVANKGNAPVLRQVNTWCPATTAPAPTGTGTVDSAAPASAVAAAALVAGAAALAA